MNFFKFPKLNTINTTGYKYNWIKDTIIQVLYIVFALTVTLTIAYISINDQYTEYYESKLIEKTKKLSYNAAVLLAEKHEFINELEIERIFNLAFSVSSNKDAEIIKYALYANEGQSLVASNIDNIQIIPTDRIADALNCLQEHGNIVEYSDRSIVEPEQGKKFGSSYTYVDNYLIFSYSPVIIDDSVRYVVLVNTSYEPFLEFGEDVQKSLYSALFRGCIIMVLSYVAFSVYSNMVKKQDNNSQLNGKEITSDSDSSDGSNGSECKDKSSFYDILKIQVIAIIIGIVLGLPLLWLFFIGNSILKFVALIFAVSMFALSAIHILRLLYWLLIWYINKPISGYSAQTIQFCVFLSVFIIVFCYSAQNSYNVLIERSRLDGLRQSSVFAAITLGQTPDDSKALYNKAQSYQFDWNSQCIIVTKMQNGFQIIGEETENIDAVQSLFNESWNDNTTVMGVRGGYIYGITPIFNDKHEVTALVGLRQVYSMYADELRRNTIDFILGMSATVLAFIMFFIELNKLLEVLSVSGKRDEKHEFKYAAGTRSLVFFAVICRHIPFFFLTLIVQGIYEHNPVTWLPIDLAKTLPLTMILYVVTFGSNVVSMFYKVNQRTFMMTGCVIGAVGFLLIAEINNFALYLLVLLVAYTGISMVYNSLWDYTKYIYHLENKYPELATVTKMTSGGDFIGVTVGMVFGAVAYDKFGLFAALLLSAVILLCLGVLIFYMIPRPESGWGDDWDEAGQQLKHNSLPKFIKSKNIIFYIISIIVPFAIAPYFIDHFSPIYANSINLSPSAVSWTSLLRALCIAYIAPNISQILTRRFVKPSVVAAISNILAALGLFIFAVFPGIPALYITSGIIGIGLGSGKTAVTEGYESFEETSLYKNKDAAYFTVTLIGGQIGTIFFTAAHFLSPNGELVFLIAIAVIICSVIHIFNEQKKGEKT